MTSILVEVLAGIYCGHWEIWPLANFYLHFQFNESKLQRAPHTLDPYLKKNDSLNKGCQT